MSFGQLRSARKAKESLSFVQPAGSGDAVLQKLEESSAGASGHESGFGTLGSGIASPSQAGLDVAEASQTGVLDEGSKTNQDVDGSQAASSRSTTGLEKTKPVNLHGCHRLLPNTLEIRESPRRGRGIFTKSDFSAGSTIMSTKPHVFVLSTPMLDQYCSACAGPAPESGLKRCPKCKTVWYCDSRCQNRDWAWHKRECGALQGWAAAAPSPELSIPAEPVRGLGRILWGSQKEGLDSTWAREIQMMHSNRSSSLQPSAVESHTHLAHSLVRYLGVTSPQELEPYGLSSAGDLVDLISRFTTNTFTLTAPSLTPIGICVSPPAAFANHSCDPNAVIVFPRARPDTSEEPLLHLIALRDIPTGKEVRISYVDTTLPTATRQKELKDVYGFACQCPACTRAATAAADPRQALWCPRRCGGSCPYPTDENRLVRCSACKAAVKDPDAVLDAVRIGQEALDKATALQFRDPEKALRYTTNVLPLLTSPSVGVLPSAHPLLALTRLHQELLIATEHISQNQGRLDEAVRAAAQYCAGIQSVLPRGHPVRAVALGELGKLLAVDEPSPRIAASDAAAGSGAGSGSGAGADMGAGTGLAGAGGFPPSGPARLRLAYESLVRAHEEMLVGFGKEGGGQLGREIREMIVRLEKELGAWTSGVRNVVEDARAGRLAAPK